MAEAQFWRKVATFIRRAPWVANAARMIWRIPQAKFTAGVVGVVFNDLNQVLLVEHVFHPYHPWGLPGGWVDRREDPSLTIQREMMEELELQVEVGSLLLARMDDSNHLDLAYRCHMMNGSIGNLSNELLEYRWVSLADLPCLHNFHYQAIHQALAIRTEQ